MMLCGHALTMATLDFLVVAQCASLLVKVVVSGWDIMQFPWVRAIAGEIVIACIQFHLSQTGH